MKELSVDQWFDEIIKGLEYRRIYGLEDEWYNLETRFYNVHPGCQNGPNLIASTGDSMLSALSVLNPRVMLSARKQADILPTMILESLDNNLIEDMRMRQEVEMSLLHAFLWGRGIVKIGYDSEWGWDPRYDFGGDQQTPMGLTFTQFNKRGNRIEYREDVSPGMPWVRSVPPHDIVVPFGTRDERDAPWMAHRVVRHIDHIKSDPKYSYHKDLEPVMSMDDFTKSYQTTMKPYRSGEEMSSIGGISKSGSSWKTEFVELWEIHDRRTNKVLVIATGHDRFLRNEIDYVAIRGLPFVSMALVPQSRNFWTTSDAYYLQQPQAELSDIALTAAKQRRVNILKLLMSSDAMEKTEIERLLSPEVGAVAFTKPGVNPKDVVASFTPGNANQGLYIDAEVIRRNARESVGISRNQMGEFETQGRRTATEVQSVQQNASMRMGRRQGRLGDLYVDSFQKINDLLFQYWTTPRWTEVMDDMGQPQWVEFVVSQLKGDYRYGCEFSSEGNMTIEQRRDKALSMVQILGQSGLVGGQQIVSYLNRTLNDPQVSALLSGGVGVSDNNTSSGSSKNANV